ncbi:signal peptidase II [Elusimicrobiota bacterium]
MKIKSIKISAFFIASLIIIDQLTKYIVIHFFQLENSALEVLPFFRIIHTTNTGIAFSLFQGSNVFFAIFAALVILIFIVWYIKNFNSLLNKFHFSIILLLSGAIGNLIDRLFRGHVVDFLDFNIGAYHWPAFNFADSCITVGGILLFIFVFTYKKEAK